MTGQPSFVGHSTSPHKLYEQARGDAAEYRRLMVEHGHLVPTLTREECVAQGGHFWPNCDPGYGSVPCTRCGYDPGAER